MLINTVETSVVAAAVHTVNSPHDAHRRNAVMFERVFRELTIFVVQSNNDASATPRAGITTHNSTAASLRRRT